VIAGTLDSRPGDDDPTQIFDPLVRPTLGGSRIGSKDKLDFDANGREAHCRLGG
jgi:hypothetical protein